jgi:mRNA interferase HicA
LDEANSVASPFAKTWLRAKREGRQHSLWANPLNGQVEAVPRHVEIPDVLARKICRGLAIPEVGKQ